MQNPTEYHQYAQECESLAKRLPKEHTETLLNIARAWRVPLTNPQPFSYCGTEASSVEGSLQRGVGHDDDYR
jgi:hypothetical protein